MREGIELLRGDAFVWQPEEDDDFPAWAREDQDLNWGASEPAMYIAHVEERALLGTYIKNDDGEFEKVSTKTCDHEECNTVIIQADTYYVSNCVDAHRAQILSEIALTIIEGNVCRAEESVDLAPSCPHGRKGREHALRVSGWDSCVDCRQSHPFDDETSRLDESVP
jgi:hypothetical protein